MIHMVKKLNPCGVSGGMLFIFKTVIVNYHYFSVFVYAGKIFIIVLRPQFSHRVSVLSLLIMCLKHHQVCTCVHLLFVSDIGCGSGLSGEALEEAGHYWVSCYAPTLLLSLSFTGVLICLLYI